MRARVTPSQRKHKARTVVVTISGLFLTWLQTRTPLLPSTSVAALRLVFLSVSVLPMAVSKHIVWQAKISADPFQSVCITLSVNPRKSLFISPLSPNQF